jgi:Uma2 family endonuclease
MAVEQPRTLTYADYAALPDDGRRYELIDGELFEMAAPSTRHQDLVVRLGWAFHDHVRRHGGGRVYVAPCDVVLSDTVTVQPDVVYLSDADAHRITAPNIQGPPTLVVEVLSAPRHDLVRKRELYARFAVPEYWIADPDADRVEVYRLAGAGTAYAKPILVEPGEQLATDLVPGLTIDVAELLEL